MSVLRVFVANDCSACTRARQLADIARERFPGMRVEVVNLSDPPAEPPEEVFAVPTFVLDGEVLSLGNPRPAGLMRRIEARLVRTERE